MIISAIVAVAKNNVIGRDNDIPWHLPADLKYFKKTTLDHHIIMGRKSFESIGRPLPKRTNVIITRNPFFIASNCLVTRTVEEALMIARENEESEAFIIGGAQIYDLTKDHWDRLYLTEVDLEVEGDVLFPELNMDEWTLVSEDPQKADEKNEYDYNFKIYERKKLD
ncbi:MAG: dihydrofolate reductase [Saprospiraceae bacterium]|jgi:dihydrofolate reductase